jgi:hypothetical protein
MIQMLPLLQNLDGNPVNTNMLYKRLLISISSIDPTFSRFTSNTATPNSWLELFSMLK